MNDDKTGGPAFPPAYNLTLRDYFAAKAMQAIVNGDYQTFADMASDAYAIADAMIAARKEDK